MAYLDEDKNLDEASSEVVVEQSSENNDVVEEEIVVEEESSKETENSVKISSKNSKKKGTSKIKGTFSELKKVSWPGFGKVVKQTAVVLSVTLIFLVVIMGIDQLLYFLFNLIQPK